MDILDGIWGVKGDCYIFTSCKLLRHFLTREVLAPSRRSWVSLMQARESTVAVSSWDFVDEEMLERFTLWLE